MVFDQLKVFYQVARARSFTRAASELGIDQSCLSRKVTNLEAYIGAKLFTRRSTGITLSQAGNVLFSEVEDFLNQIEGACDRISRKDSTPAGQLSLWSPIGFGLLFLPQYLESFLKKYPQISLKIHLHDIPVNLTNRNVDAFIRPYEPKVKGFVQHYLIKNHFRLYASKQYLNTYGNPKSMDELDAHKLIAITQTGAEYFLQKIDWHLLRKNGKAPRKPYIQASNPLVRTKFAAGGHGIVSLCKEQTNIKELDLVEVLPHEEGVAISFCLAYPEHFSHDAKITALGEYLEECFKKDYP